MPKEFELSRRKALAALGTVGAASAGAGLGTSAFFSDQETFENNQLTAGMLDLRVGWTVRYFDWIDSTPRVISESELTDTPGPLVQLEDVKPGDVITHALDTRIVGNPGFISVRCFLKDAENGITEPEDVVNGPGLDGWDGTPGGDLGEALRMVVWFDDGDGLPQEIWAGDFPDTEEEFVMAVGDADRPSDIFDLQSPNLGAAGTALQVCQETRLLDPRVDGHVAEKFPNSFCYEDSETESIGVLVWVPNDIPGMDDNIIQTDRCEYSIRFGTVQCRHNVAANGRPLQPFEIIDDINLLHYPASAEVPDISDTLAFNSQLSDGFVEFSLDELNGLAEPVNKSEDESSAPADSPDILPLTVYSIEGDDLSAPKYNKVEVTDQFTTDGETSELEIKSPVFFFDQVTEKRTPESIVAEPFFPTPMVGYIADEISFESRLPEDIATRDQFTDQSFTVVESVDLFVEPVVKRRDGEIEADTTDDVRPLIAYLIPAPDVDEPPHPDPLLIKDQFRRHPDAYDLDLGTPVWYFEHATKIKKGIIEDGDGEAEL